MIPMRQRNTFGTMRPLRRLSPAHRLLFTSCAALLMATTDVCGQRIENSAMRKDATATMFQKAQAATVFSKRDVISLRFMVDAKPDSISTLLPDGFTIVSGPWTRREFTQHDGVSTDLHGVLYEVKAVKRGRLPIPSPTFHFGEQQMVGNDLELTIKRR